MQAAIVKLYLLEIKLKGCLDMDTVDMDMDIIVHAMMREIFDRWGQ